MFDTIWWKYLHVYMPRQHTLLCAIPTAVCQWTVNVTNCQNVRRRRCKQTLFTLLLVSNATPIENIAIQFIHKNTPNATLPPPLQKVCVPTHYTWKYEIMINTRFSDPVESRMFRLWCHDHNSDSVDDADYWTCLSQSPHGSYHDQAVLLWDSNIRGEAARWLIYFKMSWFHLISLENKTAVHDPIFHNGAGSQ